MNRLLSALILFMSILMSAGQNRLEDNAWSVPRVGGEGIIEPSPEVAAMRRYTDFPVSHASGTVDISIPLLTLPNGLADITIGITCQTGGIKHQDFQSAVGLGWTLTGLGCVSRQINGFPDEWHGRNNQRVDFNMRDSPYDIDYMRSIVECRTETEYDRYSYSIPGYSGSFMIAYNQIIQLPPAEVKIIRTPDRQNPAATESFTLTTPEGLVYEMTEQEHTSYSYIPHPQVAFYYDHSYDGAVTAWHVTRISHPESSDDVRISYYPMQEWIKDNTVSLMTYSYTVTSAMTLDDPMKEMTGHDGSTNRTSFHNQRLPYEIKTRAGRVWFNIPMKYDGITHDMPSEYLRGIKQYDNEGNIVRSVSFDNESLFNDGRRRLDGVTVTQDGVVTDRYRFTYYDGTDADGYDVFGYPNGSWKETMESFSVLDTHLELSSRRRPDRAQCKSNSLKTVSNIDGLTTTLGYESSSVHVNGSGVFRGTVDIGIRVASITVRDSITGRFRTRSFRYEEPMCDITLNAITYADYIAQSGTHVDRMVSLPNGPVQSHIYSLGVPYLATSRLKGYPVEQARIYYGKVTETISGTDLMKPVRTIYEYDISHLLKRFITSEWYGYHNNHLVHGPYIRNNFGCLNNIYSFQNDKDHRLLKLNVTRGYFKETAGAVPLLKRKTLYECVGNVYQKRQADEYTYTSTEFDNIRTGIHCESVVFRYFDPAIMTQVSDNIVDMNDVHYFVMYIGARSDLLASSTRTIYYPDGNSRAVTTGYQYCQGTDLTDRLPGFGTDSLKIIPSSCRLPVVTTVRSGDESVTRYNARSEHAMLSSVLAKARGHNMRHLPVADRWVFETAQGRDTVSRRYSYARYDMGGGCMMTRPCHVSVETGGQIVSEQRYDSYDMFGNITLMTDIGGRCITAQWIPGYCLLSEMTLPDVGLTTTYTHRPLVGCTSITSTGGKTIRYGYDAGRLTSVWNTAGELLEEHDYLYYDDGTENCGSSNRIRTTVHDTSRRKTQTQPQLRSGPMRTSVAIWPDTPPVKNEPETGVWEEDGGYGEECEDCETETSSVRTVHYDGFGMPVQTVSTVAGGSLVRTATEYDALDRPVRQYLPVPDDDSFLTLFHTVASSHYGDNYPYSQVTYRGMPGDQPLRILKEGEAMQGHPERYEYLCNSVTDQQLHCRRYYLSDSRDSETVTLDGCYPAGALDVTRQTDPDGCTLLTFTDWRGLKILERRPVDNDTYADTYYLYDVMGNVRVILQPEAVVRMTRDSRIWTDRDEVLDKLAFINRYDRRGNCIYAKVPGAGAVRMRYDRYNRLAYRQTAVMRERSEAEFILYDPIGRVAVCGITADGLPQTVPVMTARYDGGNIAGSIGDTGYTVPSDLDWSDITITRVNYYDSYDCRNMDGFSSLPTAGMSLNAQKVRGNLAAARTAVYSDIDDDLGPEAYLYTLVDYDIEGNVTGTVESTILPGTALATEYTLSRQGYPLEVKYELLMPDTVYVMNHKRYFDTSGFISMEKAIPGYESEPVRIPPEPDNDSATEGLEEPSAAPWRFTVDYSYDGLGRLESQTTGAGNRMSYSYNLRGQMKSVTSPALTQTLCYDDGGTPCYNGNISAMKVGYGDGSPVGRSFTYDRLNRLSSMTSDDGFNTACSYNLNSGPLTIMRQGVLSDGTCGTVDDLTVSYDGSRPVKVADHADPVILEGSLDFAAGEARYSYDSDGRMTSDTGRGIDITYNPIDRPAVITTDTGTQYRYTYDATGRKLGSRRIADTPVTAGENEAMLYIGPFELKSTGGATALHRINLPWGYITGNGDRMTYVTDYQGNIRAVVDSLGNAVQTTDYYPCGLPMTTSAGPAANPYKYSGKELETRDGLNRYDFHARQYDPALGLFDRPDPMAAEYPWLTPYLYCAANPVMHIDPTGRDTYVVDLNGYFKLSETTTDDFDRIMSIMGSCPHMDVSKSFLSSLHEIKGTLKSSDGSLTENIIISMYNGASISNELHEFLAANTDVEWSYSEMKTLDGNIDKYIGTTHLSNSDASPDIMLETAITNNVMDILFVHNHSIGNTTVSQGDINFAIKTQTKFPNAKFSIIFPNSNLPAKFYDRNSTAGLLQEAICIGKR